MDGVKGVELAVFTVLFLAVSASASWPAAGAAPDLDSLDEWGLGGRSFGRLGHLVPHRR